MNPRRIASIVLTLLAVVCLVVALTDVHADTCTWTRGPGKTPPKDSDRQPVTPASSLSFQPAGGDNAFIAKLREGFADEVKRRQPSIATIVDGPQPKGGMLVKASLTSGDVTWTPLWAKAALGVHVVVQGPSKGRDQFVGDSVLTLTCSGLVSRSNFQSQFPDEIVRWLGDELDTAVGAGGGRVQ
jgi:hypothetical protein